jgi:hypothetical protein
LSVTPRKLSERLQVTAAVTDTLRIRIASSPHNARSRVQQFVIRPVLTDDEVMVGVIARHAIDVMNLNAIRQSTP